MQLGAHDMLNTAALDIRAAVSDVRVASEWMAGFATAQGVPPEQINRLDLCLNEALANVISYGNEAALTQPVLLRMHVRCEHGACEAAVTVSDAGMAFDMAHAPIADRPHSLAEAEPGGLGLLMIRSFSDALTYQRSNSRNELTFSVRWNGQAAA